jgi:hypothetical protein
MTFQWVLDDDINLRVDRDGVVVEEANPDDDHPYSRTVRLTYHSEPGAGHGVLRFNGQYVDVGDDFPRFLGIMDAAAEGVTFIGDTSQHEPVAEPDAGQDVTYERSWSNEPGGYAP